MRTCSGFANVSPTDKVFWLQTPPLRAYVSVQYKTECSKNIGLTRIVLSDEVSCYSVSDLDIEVAEVPKVLNKYTTDEHGGDRDNSFLVLKMLCT